VSNASFADYLDSRRKTSARATALKGFEPFPPLF
jgi:hypothetical protein